jgi:Helix-turn-helix domain
MASRAEVEQVKCLCPCGEEFEPKRAGQIYKDASHRQRDKNRRWPLKRLQASQIPLRNTGGERQGAQASGVTPLPSAQIAGIKIGASKWIPQPVVSGPTNFIPRVWGHMLTVAQVSELLRISRGGLAHWRLRKSGPPYIRVTRKIILYPRAGLEDFLRDRYSETVWLY